MPDERNDIHELRLQISALLHNSTTTPACKAIASLMAAAWACRTAEMPPEVAGRMIVSYYRADPLE